MLRTGPKIRHFVLIFFLVLASYALWVCFYVGAFKPVVFSHQKAGPWNFIYKEHLGPYHKTVSVIEEVETWAKLNSIDCHLTYGEYLDDPKSVDEDRLHSRGGCLVASLPKMQLPENFKTETRGEQTYVIASFSGSPGIGPFKVYPKALDYLQENHLQSTGPVVEVYEVLSDNKMDTKYYFPVKD